MAKKNKGEEFEGYNPDDQEKIGSKIITVLIALVIVIIMLGTFLLLIKLDVGGFGSKVLRPVLKDIPVVNSILPSVSDATLAEENDYPYTNLTQAIDRIKELEAQIEKLKKQRKDYSTEVSDLEKEVERLKVFEENQLEYEKRLKEFEENIVFNDKAPDISEYKAYYESISPENAEEIYRQVIEQMAVSEQVLKYASTFSKMKPKKAAPILEAMTADLDLVSQILMAMKPAERGAILAEMDSIAAAKITKKMAPVEE